jgi:hypothetical protein
MKHHETYVVVTVVTAGASTVVVTVSGPFIIV